MVFILRWLSIVGQGGTRLCPQDAGSSQVGWAELDVVTANTLVRGTAAQVAKALGRKALSGHVLGRPSTAFKPESIGIAMSPPSIASVSRSSSEARPSEAVGFFNHHGAWAPGVRLFRQLRFKSKAALISAVFLIPIMALGWSFFNDKADAIAFSAKEKVGVEYARDAIPLLKAAQNLRMAAAGGKAAEADLAAARSAVDAAVKKLAAADARLGADLGTTAFFDKLKAAHAAAASSSGDAEAVFAAHTRLVAAVLDALGQSTDGSNLTLDPDLDSYYVMDMSMVRNPQIAELIAQLRQAGMSALDAAPATPAQIRKIASMAPLLSYHEEQMKIGLAKATGTNPSLTAAFKSEDAMRDTRAFAEMVERSFLGEAAGGDRAAFVAAAQRATDQQFALSLRLLDAMDQLLAVRIGGMNTVRNVTAAIVCVFLLLGAYLFYSFYLVTQGGLREVQMHLQAMTGGDLTTQPKPWGRDEEASLMRTLADMQMSLRKIVSQVRGSSDAIVRASGDIASVSIDLSSRTEQTSANLQQSASSMEEISSTVKQTADSSTQAAQVASDNAKVAAQGGQVIADVVNTMQEIHASSSKIADIIGTIDGIAFQTNILALNAAVEAARAGEQGRGFAVVAAEVRSLAQRSALAAKEIKGLITASGERVESGTRVVQGAGQTMQKLVDNARRISNLLSEISTAAKEQSNGVSQVGAAVHELDKMTQQNAALVGQTAASASSLKDHASGLATEVAKFRLPARA
jgi:methyl-accepting chemotaxis protein